MFSIFANVFNVWHSHICCTCRLLWCHMSVISRKTYCRLVKRWEWKMQITSSEGLPHGASGKDPLAKQETEEMLVPSLDLEDPLAKGMATHSSTLAWRIPWTEKPGELQYQFSSVQSLSHVRLFATPCIAARQAFLSITNSQSSLRLTSIESVMPSSHLILCRALLLLPPIPPSIRVFSNESTLRMRWPK